MDGDVYLLPLPSTHPGIDGNIGDGKLITTDIVLPLTLFIQNPILALGFVVKTREWMALLLGRHILPLAGLAELIA